MPSQNEQRQPTQADALQGIYIVGDWLNQAPLILKGDVDFELLCGAYFTQKKTHATKIEDLQIEEVQQHVKNIKNFVKVKIEAMFEEFRITTVKQDILEKKKRQQEIYKNLQENQKPSELGTTAELAEKHDISKNEVRRLRRENKLHTLGK